MDSKLRQVLDYHEYFSCILCLARSQCCCTVPFQQQVNLKVLKHFAETIHHKQSYNFHYSPISELKIKRSFNFLTEEGPYTALLQLKLNCRLNFNFKKPFDKTSNLCEQEITSVTIFLAVFHYRVNFQDGLKPSN
jgi:hypothetical protein